MEIYRDLARQNLENIDSSDLSHFNTTKAEGPNPNLRELWDDINAHGETQKDENISENLLVAQIFLQNVQPEYVLSDDDREATDAIILWIVKSILPSEEFEVAWEEAQLATNEVKRGIFDRFETARARARLGLSVLESLIRLITIEKIGDPVLVIAALAAFTNPEDPWTPAAASSLAQALLGAFEELKARDNGSLVAFSSDILSRFVKLSFSKTKTPGITAEGRKDAHPVKQPRFDPSIFDKGSKPWKHRDVYIVTVLSWVIQQYMPSDQATIERQFPLLIPAILSLIDDESLPYKARGCKLLNQMLICLEKAKSDILKRTNLDSVFEEALNPCLLSLPSLTPEDQSTHLLQVAYPALFSVIRTRFPSSLPSKQFYRPAPSQRRTEEQESNSRITILTRLLRHSIISSYHHISSPRPSEDTLITSYPHPRLSALLLRQLTTAIAELGIHTVKHLQEIVPILTSTLTNPFGTAYLPLLTDAAHCTRQLVLSAWPRIARWRAEILNGLCGCWLHLKEDEENIRARGGGENEDMTALKQVLKQCVCELKIVLESSSDIDSGGMRETIDVDGECKQLVDGDERLAELF